MARQKIRNSTKIVSLFRAGFGGGMATSFASGRVSRGCGLRIGKRIVGSKPMPLLHWSIDNASDLDDMGLSEARWTGV